MSPLRAALESALAENPDDIASHMAYADLLVEEGDPRGEFIQVQLALEDPSRGTAERAGLKRREEELLARHQAEWIGEAAPVFVWPGRWTSDNRASWPFGLTNLEHPKDFQPIWFSRGWIEYLDLPDFNDRFAEALSRSPTIRLLRYLTIRCSVGDESGVTRLADWPGLDHVKTFQLGHEECDCDVSGDGVSVAVSGMDRLEELALYAYTLDVAALFALPMPNLRTLTVNNLDEYPLEVLARNPSLGKLDSLTCQAHARYHQGDTGYITAEGFSALVRSPHLQNLTRLALHHTDIGDEGVAALVASGMLRRLRVLDLSFGRVSDEGARLLASSPDLPRLEGLRLSWNMLTPSGVRALLATGVNLDAAEGQFDAAAIKDNAHLGDWE